MPGVVAEVALLEERPFGLVVDCALRWNEGGDLSFGTVRQMLTVGVAGIGHHGQLCLHQDGLGGVGHRRQLTVVAGLLGHLVMQDQTVLGIDRALHV